MQCNVEQNKAKCSCTYTSCDKRGKCCLCVPYHRDKGELPGCFFNTEQERTYDRSLGNFLKMHGCK